MTTDVCPDLCLVCGYLTYGLDLCYFCLSPVAEPLDGQVRQAFYDNGNARQSRRSCIVKAAS